MRWQLLSYIVLGCVAGTAPSWAEATAAGSPSASPPVESARSLRVGSAGAAIRRERLPDGAARDTFIGDGQARLFTLSWRGVEAGSVRAALDGQPLAEGVDYTFNAASGVLRLSRPLLSSLLLRVTYRVPPYFSSSNTPLESRRGYRSLADRLAAAVTPAAPDRDPLPLPALGTSLHPDGPAVGAPFEHLATGLRLTDVREQYTGDPLGSGSLSYTRADAFDPSAAPNARESFSTDLNLQPSAGSRLLFDSSLSRTSIFADSYEGLERQRLQFDQTFGKSTAALMWDHRRSDVDGVANALDALSLSLTHPFSHSTFAEAFFADERSLALGRDTRGLFTLRQLFGNTLEAQGSALIRSSTLSGNSVEAAARLFAHPTAGTDLDLSYSQATSDRYGAYQKLSLDANAALGSNVQLLGQASQRYSDQLGTITNVGLGLTARPVEHSLLEAAVSESEGSKTGTATSQTLRFSLDPSSIFKIQVGYDGLQSTRDGTSQNALWLVQAGGRSYIKLEGYTGYHTSPEGTFYNDSLYRLEVRPADAVTLSGGVRQVLGPTERNSVADLGATLSLVRGVDVSAVYRRPTDLWASDAAPQAGDLRLSLAPVGGFRIFGEYSLRPEDERGALLDEIHRSLGLETRFGSFSVRGRITRVDGALAATAGQQLDLLASLGLGGGTRVYGGYRTQDSFLSDQTRSQLFRFGITQAAGPSLFLSLEGQFGWLQTGGGDRTVDPDQTLAQARLGLKF